MKINKLIRGTKLMWDAPPNELDDPNKPIVYPAIVTEQHYNKRWVKIKTGSNSSWMGPDQPYLRRPTQEELDTFTWPEID